MTYRIRSGTAGEPRVGIIINGGALPFAMARRLPKNYKRINVKTKNMGSAGDQKLLATFSKSDAQSSQVSWLNNVNVSAMLNEGDGDAGGMLFYLTTGSSWDDDYIISSNAIPGYGGKVSLSAKRRIRTNATDLSGSFGLVYLWGEVTDLSYTDDVKIRLVVEQWGRNVITVLA